MSRNLGERWSQIARGHESQLGRFGFCAMKREPAEVSWLWLEDHT